MNKNDADDNLRRVLRAMPDDELERVAWDYAAEAFAARQRAARWKALAKALWSNPWRICPGCGSAFVPRPRTRLRCAMCSDTRICALCGERIRREPHVVRDDERYHMVCWDRHLAAGGPHDHAWVEEP